MGGGDGEPQRAVTPWSYGQKVRILPCSPVSSACSSAWPERVVRGHEAGGSNPPTQTSFAAEEEGFLDLNGGSGF